MNCILCPAFSYLETWMLQQAPRYACSTYFLSTSKDFLSCSQHTQDLTQLLTYLGQQKIKHARTHRGKNKILKPRLQVYEGTTNGNKISESLISKDFIFQFRQLREGVTMRKAAIWRSSVTIPWVTPSPRRCSWWWGLTTMGSHRASKLRCGCSHGEGTDLTLGRQETPSSVREMQITL